MKRETTGRAIVLAVSLLLVGMAGHTGQKQAQRVADFVEVSQNGVPVFIRWSSVSVVKLYDDNGGAESFWEITVQGSQENPIIVKNAYAFPLIMERLKDSH
jgi:hypothetical protein